MPLKSTFAAGLCSLFACLFFVPVTSRAQSAEDWIAPEGFIINYRTLTWEDFQGKEDKEFSDKLAQQNLMARAYVCPAIYFTADSGRRTENGRVAFNFKVKCAFQSRAFVRESTKEQHSNYVLIHEQDHYDIALNFANILQNTLTSHDYDPSKYNDEIDKAYKDLMERYYKIQETYDNEVNPEGRDDKEQQYLWDMRIKKCLENMVETYYSSPETAVQSEKMPGQIVKRIPGETSLQFAVRTRPLYTEMPKDLMPKVTETTEWTPATSIIAFYSQKYYQEEDGAAPADKYRTLAYLFVPTAQDTYKRILIDTISNESHAVKITDVFFANADSDQAKELVIMAQCPEKTKEANGTVFINRVYDNVTRPLPGKLRRLDDATGKIEGGFEGMKAGKLEKAKCKAQKDVLAALSK
jgi:hypothetical protein